MTPSIYTYTPPISLVYYTLTIPNNISIVSKLMDKILISHLESPYIILINSYLIPYIPHDFLYSYTKNQILYYSHLLLVYHILTISSHLLHAYSFL